MALDLIVTLLGILGVIILGADILLEVLDKLNRNHKLFSTLYVIANFLLLVYSIYFNVWLFVVLNGFLFGVGIYTYYISHRK